MVHKLSNGALVGGETNEALRLATDFHVWANKECLLTDEEVVACWTDGYEKDTATYFSSPEEAKVLAASGFAKLKGKDIPYFEQ